MKHKVEEKIKAVSLRQKGLTINEIVEILGVAKSSVSVWVRNTPLGPKAKARLLTKISDRQIKAADSRRQKTLKKVEVYTLEAEKYFTELSISRKEAKLICALLYWCEGAKDINGVRFVNSDPNVVKTFLVFFRQSFKIDISKIRCLMHLHEYHNPIKQRRFWAKVTGVPESNFYNYYLKPNTGKRKKMDYPGCISIIYGDNDIARQLYTLGKVFVSMHGPIG